MAAHGKRSWVLVLASPDRAHDVVASATKQGLSADSVATADEAIARIDSLRESLAVVVGALGTSQETSFWPVLAHLKQPVFRQVFSVVLSFTASQDVRIRLDCFAAGARMVTRSSNDLGQVLAMISDAVASPGQYACPHCGLTGLTEEALCTHMPLYHTTEPNSAAPCPICSSRNSALVCHLKQTHGPLEDREPPAPPYPAFAWCVCRRPSDGKFLMVNEPAGISGGKPRYWLPAGRVDAGESLVEGGVRECNEEAGVAATVIGLLRIMFDNDRSPEVIRVVLLMQPADSTVDPEPKSIPDYESAGALWVAADDLGRKLSQEDYRNPDPAELYPSVADGSLPSHSIETAAFSALESVIRRLTLGEAAASAQLPQVWRQLRSTYPQSVFRQSG